MLGGLRRLLLAVFVAGAVLWSPAAAFACSGSASAVNVYKECVPTGSGSKPTSGGQSGNTNAGSGSTPISSQAAKALRHVGKKQRKLYSTLVKSYGTSRLQAPSSTSAATEPSAIGSAFDLGSGPTALLIVLAGTAVLLLGGSGLRVWRHRHRA